MAEQVLGRQLAAEMRRFCVALRVADSLTDLDNH
jgi:hypothetical protein